MLAVFLVLVLGLTPGEQLDYEVRLGPVAVGSLELATLVPDSIRGEYCRHFRATLEVSLRFLFRGRYVLDSWATYDDLRTMRSAKTTEETRYRAQWTADYLYQDSVVAYSDGDSFALPGPARDLLTAWHYLRSQAMVSGDTLRFHAHSDRREQEVTIIARDMTVVETPAGRFRTIELAQHGSGLIGRILVSDDERRLPVLIRTSIGGVPLTAQLRAVRAARAQ